MLCNFPAFFYLGKGISTDQDERVWGVLVAPPAVIAYCVIAFTHTPHEVMCLSIDSCSCGFFFSQEVIKTTFLLFIVVLFGYHCLSWQSFNPPG